MRAVSVAERPLDPSKETALDFSLRKMAGIQPPVCREPGPPLTLANYLVSSMGDLQYKRNSSRSVIDPDLTND